MSEMSLDRREFARFLAAGAAAGLPATAASTAGAADTADPVDQSKAAADAGPADLVLELVRRHSPNELTAEQLAELRTHIEHHQLRSRVLSGFRLTNADEPATLFRAYRAGKK